MLPIYPGEAKPIERYLIIELKKGIANHDTVLQAMRYVDWVCKEYAAGDYSRIEAKIIAHRCRRNVIRNREEDCVVITKSWIVLKSVQNFVRTSFTLQHAVIFRAHSVTLFCAVISRNSEPMKIPPYLG